MEDSEKMPSWSGADTASLRDLPEVPASFTVPVEIKNPTPEPAKSPMEDFLDAQVGRDVSEITGKNAVVVGDSDEEDQVADRVDNITGRPALRVVDIDEFGDSDRNTEEQVIAEPALSAAELLKMERAGIIESPDMERSRDENLKAAKEIWLRLEAGEDLTQEDLEKLNKFFVSADAREKYLSKRDKALGMDPIAAKYQDIVGPGGAAFEGLTEQERKTAKAIYDKAQAVMVTMEVGYDGMGVSPQQLRQYRDQTKENLYKRGKKLGEVGSMKSIDEINANKKDLAKSLIRFVHHEQGVTTAQKRAVNEYIKPKNKITNKEVAKLNDICALGLLRTEGVEANRQLEKQRKILGRTDVVNNALGFVERRLGRFQFVKGYVDIAKGVVKKIEDDAAEKYKGAEKKAMDLRWNSEKRRKEIRNKIKDYKGDRSKDEAALDKSVLPNARAEIVKVFKQEKEKLKVRWGLVFGEGVKSFFKDLATEAVTNVLIGSGVPDAFIDLFGGIKNWAVSERQALNRRKAARAARPAPSTNYQNATAAAA